MDKIMKLRFGNALLADFAKPQPNGKIDAIGIFTRFNAWAYPCFRNWTLIFTIYDIPLKGINIHLGLKRKNGKSLHTLQAIDLKGDSKPNSHTVPISLNYKFEKEGDYEIICSIKDTNAKLKILFNISTLNWPKFAKEEIELVKKYKKQIPYRLTAQVNCNVCGHAYIFEESILKNEDPQGGTIRFPEDGIFECSNCGHEMILKDIQGQLRASLKDNLLLLKRIRNV